MLTTSDPVWAKFCAALEKGCIEFKDGVRSTGLSTKALQTRGKLKLSTVGNFAADYVV